MEGREQVGTRSLLALCSRPSSALLRPKMEKGTAIDPVVISSSDSGSSSDDSKYGSFETVDELTYSDKEDYTYEPSNAFQDLTYSGTKDFTADSFDVVQEYTNPSYVDLVTTDAETDKDKKKLYEGVVDSHPLAKKSFADAIALHRINAGLVGDASTKRPSSKKKPSSANDVSPAASVVGDNFSSF